MATDTDIVNQAIIMMGGNQPPVTGTAPSFDDSAAGKAAAALYRPCVATVARQFAFEFGRQYSVLTVTGNTPPDGWAQEYFYPVTAVQVWQVKPAGVVDKFDPIPGNWVIGNAIVSGVQRKVIWTNIAGAVGVYHDNPVPDAWDPLFREAVVRLLASEIAIALAGKPDTSQLLLQSGAQFETIAEARDS